MGLSWALQPVRVSIIGTEGIELLSGGSISLASIASQLALASGDDFAE